MVNSLLKKAYAELFESFGDAYNQTGRTTSNSKTIKEPKKNHKVNNKHGDAIQLGSVSAKLAQVKGKLAAAIDKMDREKVIERKAGKIKILRPNDYNKIVGDLPIKIKELQKKLEPEVKELNEIKIPNEN